MMGAFAWLEDWSEVMMDKPRGTGTPSILHSADTNNNTSHHPTTPSYNSVRARHDTRQAHTMIQVESENNKTSPRRSFGTVAVALSPFALLAMALAPSVEASTSSQSSCVQITDTALYSFCASSGRVTSLAFVLEGTTTGTANTARTETGGLRVKAAANIAARPVHLGGAFVPCPATGVVVTVGFAAPVTSIAYPDEAAPGENVATFYAETLESNPTEFTVVLETAGMAVGTNVVTYVKYSDNEGNSPDMSGLMTLPSTLECDDDGGTVLDAAATTGVSRELQVAPLYTCDVCFDLLLDQRDVLAMYDNGGKRIVCDPTCVDNVSDHTDCNYFDLGKICRGCGECSSCTPCPAPDETPAPTPTPTPEPTKPPDSEPTFDDATSRTEAPVVVPSQIAASLTSSDDSAADGDDDEADEYDCSRCADVSAAQMVALAMYDNGGKKIVCDPTCMDSVSDHLHCNYFGLGQICRACGDCTDCTPCP